MVQGHDIISHQALFYSSFDSHSSRHLTDTTAARVDVQKGNGSVGEKKKKKKNGENVEEGSAD